jgi:hypothetical protein
VEQPRPRGEQANAGEIRGEVSWPCLNDCLGSVKFSCLTRGDFSEVPKSWFQKHLFNKLPQDECSVDREKRLMAVGASLIADHEPSNAMEPRDASRDDPAVATKA